MMEESIMWEDGYDHKDLDWWNSTFINSLDFKKEDFLLPSLNNALFEEDGSDEALAPIREMPHKCSRDQADSVLHDEILSDLNLNVSLVPWDGSIEFCSMDEEIQDDSELPDKSDGVMMDSERLCKESRDVLELADKSDGVMMDSERLCEEISDVLELTDKSDETIMDSERLCEDGRDVLELSDKSDETMIDSERLCEDSRDDSCGDEEEYSVGNTSAPVECQWPIIPLTLCKIDSAEYRGVALVHLLIVCAEAISEGAHDLVEAILCRVKELVSPSGRTMERVGYYLLQSLEQRSHCSVDGDDMEEHVLKAFKRTKDPNYFGALSLLNQAYPYIRFAHFIANQSILEAIPDKAQTVHILDFDIQEGMQWPPLIEALKSESHKIGHLKLTAVKWDDDDDDDGNGDLGQFSWSCKDTGRRLSEYACSLGIPFSFQETQLENLKDKLSCSEDEMVVVNCMWALPHMLQRSSKKLSEFIEGACHLNPAILTLGTGPNGILGHKKISLLEGFVQRLKNSCALFDSMEAGLPEQYGSARATMERLFMVPMICRPINYLSDEDEEFVRVVDIPLQYGFAEGQISNKNTMNAKLMAEEGEHYRMELKGNNQLHLLWQSIPLTSISTWKPTNFS